MSVVYSLICWGGSTGKTPTSFSTADNTVAIAAHGARSGFAFQIVSGSLPSVSGSALQLNTVYYLKQHATDEGLAYVYYDAALTSQVVFTSSSTDCVFKSNYYLTLPSTDRWGTRIYDGIRSCTTARGAATTYYTDEVWEIGEEFRELTLVGTGAAVTTTALAKSCTVTTFVDGVRSSGFHNGIVGTGFSIERIWTGSQTFSGGALGVLNYGNVDGFTAISTVGSTSYSDALAVTNFITSAKNMIAIGSMGVNNKAISVGAKYVTVDNCIALGSQYGFALSGNDTSSKVVVTNCLASKNVTGFYPVGNANISAHMYNCISYKNTTNWWSQLNFVASRVISHNVGSGAAAGEKAWIIATGSVSFVATDADFVNIGTTTLNLATDDFRLASGSALIDAGFNGHQDITFFDIAGNVRPGYEGGAATALDCGPYEFDHGYGPWPASTTVTFSGVNAGSEIRVYLPDGTEVAGVEDCTENQVLTWSVYAPGSPNNIVSITLLKRGFRWQKFLYTSTIGNVNLPIFQITDLGYSNL